MSVEREEAAGLSPTLGRIESVCDRFEAAWQPRPRPRIEDYWLETDGTQLLRELLVLDVVYRLRHHDHPNLGEYQARFAAHAGAIRSAFEAAGMSVPSPEPPSPDTWNMSDPDAHEDVAPLDGFNRTNAMIDPIERAASNLALARALRFQVLRPLAKGGLGEVFVARDEELRREVALKLIQEQFADDTDSRDRFLFEAEITGRLEHPGVIPVYGLGVDGKGRPYYAMRFIRGESLKESIARFHRADGPTREPGERSLALRELLGRFISVCNTIAYAHGRGVLHRDLKPANVMLGDYGETLVVDWGLAKITGRPDGEPHAEDGTQNPEPRSGTNSTKQGSWLGTPSFMSPEQAAGRIDLLGPASDIYSLGATLYNLLTGKSAFDGTDVLTVLSQVQDGTFASPRSLEPTIDRALEAVCLKAMANKPENRYASCRALAEDVERWAADEPVSAWREPFGRRVRRWGKQNRTMVTSAAVGLVASVVGLASVLIVQTQAKADLSRSLSRETRANIALAAANSELERSNDAVEARYDLAVEAIKTFHTGVSEDFLLKELQFKELRDRLLKSASDFYGKLAGLLSKESDAASLQALLSANFEVAELTGKVGRFEDALAAHRQVLAAREELAAHPSADADSQAGVGRSLTAVAFFLARTGKTNQAVATYREAEGLLASPSGRASNSRPVRSALAQCRIELAGLLHSTGHDDDALSAYRLARADQQALAESADATSGDRRDLAATIHGIAIVLSEAGKIPEAEPEYKKAMALYQKLADDNPSATDFRNRLANTHSGLGILLSNTGRTAEAEAEFRMAAALHQKLANDNPAVTQFRRRLADSDASLGVALSNTGQTTEAETEFGKAMVLYQRLADDNPAVTDFWSRLANNHNSLGILFSDSGRASEAGAEYKQAMAIYQRLADDNPAVTVFRSRLADSHVALGVLLVRTGRRSEAENEQKSAMALYQKLADDNPAVTEFRNGLALSHVNLGSLLKIRGRFPQAEAEIRKATALYQKLADDNPSFTRFRDVLATTHSVLGELLNETGKPLQAEAEYRKATGLYQNLADDHPAVTAFRSRLATSHNGLGNLLGGIGRIAEAETELRNAMALCQKLADDNPAITDFRSGLADSHNNLGGVLEMSGRLAEAEAEYKMAIALFQKLADDNPLVTVFRDGLAFALTGLGRAYSRAGKSADAVELIRRSIALREAIPDLKIEACIDLARDHAFLASIAVDPLSGLRTRAAAVEGDRAMAALLRATDAGYRNFDKLRTDPYLGLLRDRADFRVLLLDLAFPNDPFTQGR